MHLISFILLLYTQCYITYKLYRKKRSIVTVPSGNMAFLFDMVHMVSVKSDIRSYIP